MFFLASKKEHLQAQLGLTDLCIKIYSRHVRGEADSNENYYHFH